MIHLDTNYLIGLLVKGSPQAADVDGWLAAGPSLAASAIAWTEFLNGPVTPVEVSRVEAVLEGRVIPFGQRSSGGNVRHSASDLWTSPHSRAICRPHEN